MSVGRAGEGRLDVVDEQPRRQQQLQQHLQQRQRQGGNGIKHVRSITDVASK